ncbi:S8 family peptidase [Sphingomonas parva]|nr:S8 family serine peptidase [Sphingomonas parva]
MIQLLRWKMEPEVFASALDAWRARWRRQEGAARPGLGRRRATELARRRIKWFRSVNHLESIPRSHVALESGAGWLEPDQEDVRIVVLPDPADAAGALEVGTELAGRRGPSARKRIRRLIHQVELERDGRRIELLASRRRRRRGVPALGEDRSDGVGRMRALYLESLGAAIIPRLEEDEVSLLEDAGAIVLENKTVALVDTPKGEEVTPDEMPWHLKSVSIEAAREKGLTGKGVTIGILDSGIDPSHPEFKGKTIQFQAFKVTGEVRPLKRPKDYSTHGTHVAAIAAGRTVGIAPDANLVVAAVLNRRDDGRVVGSLAQILAGLNWLARGGGELASGVDVVNVSLGGPLADLGYYQTISGYRLRGSTLVAAIGNDGTKGMGHHQVPGKFDCVIAVGAVDAASQVAGFSDWGECFSHPVTTSTFKPDIMAPGVAVISAVPGGKYEAKDGTSMACPVVAGAAALLIQSNPSLRGNPDELSRQLLGLTKPLPAQASGYDARRGGSGQLDLASI